VEAAERCAAWDALQNAVDYEKWVCSQDPAWGYCNKKEFPH
jgi:hypothetical protein